MFMEWNNTFVYGMKLYELLSYFCLWNEIIKVTQLNENENQTIISRDQIKQIIITY